MLANSNVSLNCTLLLGDTVCAFVFPNTAVVIGIGVPAGPVAPVVPPLRQPDPYLG